MAATADKTRNFMVSDDGMRGKLVMGRERMDGERACVWWQKSQKGGNSGAFKGLSGLCGIIKA
jgi:hypothetical protein